MKGISTLHRENYMRGNLLSTQSLILKKQVNRIYSSFVFVVLAVLGFELRVSCLIGR
jgi:hypothetical protein